MKENNQSQSEEHFEHIPWEELMTEMSENRKKKLIRLAIGGGVVLLILGFFWTRDGSNSTVIEVGAEDRPVATTAAPASIEPASQGADLSINTDRDAGRDRSVDSSRSATVLMSESDITTTSAQNQEQLAKAYARWALTEYFTADGSGLPPLWLAENSDWPGSQEGARSFVEWLSITETQEVGGGVFRVSAIMGRLAAAVDQEYSRIAPTGVQVWVDLSIQPPRLLGNPTPISIHTFQTVETDQGQPEPAPNHILATATETAEEWGEVESTASFRSGSDWRVTMLVTDQGGLTWPMTVWLDADANPVPPPT